ncbi:MAG TPA: DUF1302 family protein [Vicinamibacterales bacterium]|jgi:hypothetical protein|nr:DUF1302 family protein [Vicinamibacterales bacterium]
MKTVTAIVAVGIWHSAFGIGWAQYRVPGTGSMAFEGYASLFLDHFPSTDPSAVELRARVFGELAVQASEALRLTASAYADALAADRGEPAYDAILRAHEVLATFSFSRADFRLGLGQVVWGRLDELQPSDVVNPLDVSRFFFEGRSEARLPVTLVRGRMFFSEDAILEAIYVPIFRRGRFDQLDEPTSPFNLLAAQSAGQGPADREIARREPARTFENAQGGLRFSDTVGRFDYSIGAYRGFRTFGVILLEPTEFVEVFPRFTMISADFESVRGPWAFRGEAAFFSDSGLPAEASMEAERSWDAGFAVDRRAGDYRLSGSMLVHDDPLDTTATLIFGADRSFVRERYNTRTFGAINVTDGSAFVRNVTAWSLRDNLALEGSIGWFFGDSETGPPDPRVASNVFGRFADRDFFYLRLKAYF